MSLSRYHVRDESTMLLDVIAHQSTYDSVKFLPIRGSNSLDIERLLRQWEEEFWVDLPAVEKIDVSFLNLNREYGLWTKGTFHFIFYRGGLLQSEVTMEGVFLTVLW